MKEKQVSATTLADRQKLREERAKLTSPIDRIAFDNRPTPGGVPLGLVLMAFEEEDTP